MAETSENTYIAYTYSYTYIIGGKEVKSSVDIINKEEFGSGSGSGSGSTNTYPIPQP